MHRYLYNMRNSKFECIGMSNERKCATGVADANWVGSRWHTNGGRENRLCPTPTTGSHLYSPPC